MKTVQSPLSVEQAKCFVFKQEIENWATFSSCMYLNMAYSADSHTSEGLEALVEMETYRERQKTLWHILHRTNGEIRQKTVFWKKMHMVWERSIKSSMAQWMWTGLCSFTVQEQMKLAEGRFKINQNAVCSFACCRQWRVHVFKNLHINKFMEQTCTEI